MRAARYHGAGDVRVETVEGSALAPDAVRLDVAAAGICGSDLGQYRHGPDGIGDEEPHPLTGETLPVRMGHEFGGVVTGTGEDVAGIDPGDTVAVNPVLSCGSCRYCADGQHHLCEVGGFIGLSGGDGGFAERSVVPAANVVPFPDGLPIEHAALVEPFAVGLHAVRGSGLSAGDSVAVFGAGPIGLSILGVAAAAGAGETFVSEPIPARREAAADLGADAAIDPGEEDPVERIRTDTGGGADIAFEASGTEAGLGGALRGTRRRGQVSVVGAFPGAARVHPMLLVAGERSVRGSLAYSGGPNAGREFGAVIDMFEDGTLDPDRLVTDRIGLDDIVEEGFEPLLAGGGSAIKVLVEP